MKKALLITALATLALTCQAVAGHYASPSAGNCGYCHKVNLITQHAGFATAVCSKCHNSTAAAVVNTIAAGLAEARVELVVADPPRIPCFAAQIKHLHL